MIEKIDTWLNGNRNYEAGYELLKAAGGSPLIQALLSTGPDAYNTTKLLSELQKLKIKLLATQPDKLQALPEPAGPEAAVAVDPMSTGTYKPDRDLEKKMRIDRLIKQLWKEICHLHGQLSVLPEGHGLYECARDLLLKDFKRKDLYDQLHYFDANGKWFDELPENQVQVIDTKDPEQLERAIKNAMANRAKANKELKRPLPVAILKHHQDRYNEFDKKIKHLQSLRHAER